MKIKTEIKSETLPNGNVSVTLDVKIDGIPCGSIPVFTGPPVFAQAVADESDSLPVVLHKYASFLAARAAVTCTVVDASFDEIPPASNAPGQSRVGADAE